MKIILILPLLATLLVTFPAFAQDIDVSARSKKKAVGVKILSNNLTPPLQVRTYEDKTGKRESEKARKLFHKANRLFESRDLSTALYTYRKAYKRWDHPRILFNMAVTLSLMSRPLKAANLFKAVLEYGPDPIGPVRYKEAREKWLQLMGALAVLRLRCTQPKVKLRIDGDVVATCPTNTQISLNSGRHLLTATRPGYVTENTDIYLPRGVLGERIVSLKKHERSIRYKTVRRFPLKWTILGATVAAALLAGGGYAIYNGRARIDDIQLDVNEAINDSFPNSFAYDDTRERKAILIQNVGTGLVSVGAVAAITATFLYIFRDKIVAESNDTGKDSEKSKDTKDAN